LRYKAYYGSKTYFTFIGDSRVQQLYYGFVKHISKNENSITELESVNTNLSYINNKLNVRVEFLWAPFVSQRMIDYFK